MTFYFWWQSVRLYDASENVLRGEFTHGGAVLDCCFHDDNSGFSASADNTVRRLLLYSTSLYYYYSFILNLTNYSILFSCEFVIFIVYGWPDRFIITYDCGKSFELCFYAYLRLVFNQEREDILGRHDAPVRCIEYSYATGCFCFPLPTYILTFVWFLCLKSPRIVILLLITDESTFLVAVIMLNKYFRYFQIW